DAFGKIGDAVALLAGSDPADTVHVAAGTYSESLTITDKKLQLVGGNGTKLNGSNPVTTPLTVTGSAADVVMDSFQIERGVFGIEVNNNAKLSVTNSVIAGGSVFGVSVTAGAQVQIANSDIVSSGSIGSTGINVAGASVSVTESMITGRDTGVVAGATGSATISRSNLAGNTSYAVQAAGAVNASGNYWGASTVAGVEAEVQGPVDFSPFLPTATDNDSGARGFVGDLSVLHVTDHGTQTSGTPRIQEATNLATGATPTVIVHEGTYDENNVITKNNVTIEDDASEVNRPVLTRTSGSNSALMTVQASGVTVQGLEFVVNQPYATAGINMQTAGDNFTNLTVHDNVFRIAGGATAGGADAYVGFATSSTAIAVRNSGGPQAPNVSITDNQILPDNSGADPALFDRAIFLRVAKGEIDGNTIWGDSHDVAAQFVAGVLNINDNDFMGVGGKDTKGAQLDITEPESYGSVNITNNRFTPYLGDVASGSHHVRSLMIKNSASNAPIIVDGNQFTVSAVGMLVANSLQTTITNNTFTPVAGDSSFTELQISNKVPTGGAIAPVATSATIQGNTFADGTVPGGIGIEFLNHNDNGTPFGTLTIGGAGTLANTFESGLDQFLVLDGESQANSQLSSRPYYNQYGSTKMSPFSQDLNAENNLFELGGVTADRAGALNPVSDLSKLFALEDKITHALDNGALGTVTFNDGHQFVTADSGSIQRGIDAADAGDTVHVQGDHSYDETVVVNKNGVTIDGDDADGAGLANSAPVLTRTSGSQQVLMSINASDVTVRDMHLTVNQNGVSAPIAPVGIAAVNSEFNNLKLVDNVIDSTGSSAANWTGSPGLSVRAAGVVLHGQSSPSSTVEHVELAGNTIDIDSGASFFQRGVWLTALNAEITGNTIAGAANDVLFQFASGGPSTISDNKFVGEHRYGGAGLVIADPNGTSPIVVSDNLFDSSNPAAYPVGLQVNLNTQGATSPISISNNKFVDHFIGVEVGSADNVSVLNNEFTPAADLPNVPAVDGDYVHILVDSQNASNSGSTAISIDTQIQGNKFHSASGSTGTAVRIEDDLPGSTFAGLQIGGAMPALQNDYSGLSSGDTAIRVTGGAADITETIGSNIESPIVVTGGSATISDSSLTGSKAGVGVTVSGGSAAISDSSISDYSTGILVEDSGSATADITLTLDGGVTISGGTTGLKLTGSKAQLGGNTLDDTVFSGQTDYVVLEAGAMGGERIEGKFASFDGKIAPTGLNDNFAIENRLTHAPDDASVGLIVVNPNALYVTTPGSGTTDETIQNAIDASVDGETINVQAGTYAENLNVHRSVTLLGANSGVAGSGVRGAESTIKAVLTPDANPAEMILISADDVRISGFTLDGQGGAIRAVHALEVDGAVVEDNIIAGAERGVQYSGGAAGNSGGLVTNNWIKDLVVTGKWGGESYGVVSFDSSYAAVVDNKMAGLDVGVFEQYFYQPNGVSNDANTISGNDITAKLLGYGTNERSSNAATTKLSDNTFALTTKTGSIGVQLFNIYKDGGIELSDNTISGAGTGVYAFIDGGSVDISGGSISGGNIGIQLTNYLADYAYPATNSGAVTVSGVELTDNVTGILVEDNALSDAEVTLNLTGGVKINGGAIGIQVSGPYAKLGGSTLDDTVFTKQSAAYVVLEDGAMDNLRVDGTQASFDGQVAPTGRSENFAIEDKLVHAPDSSDAGLIVVNSGSLYVTTPGTGATDEKIQNAIDAAIDGETVNVQAGTYTENLTVGKSVSVIGEAGSTTLKAASAGNLIAISSTDGNDDISIENLNLDGVNGLAGAGVFVGSSSSLDTLSVSGGTVENFGLYGVGVFGNSVNNVTLSDLDFSANGLSGIGGTADIQFFE
ncbi:MAG: hypothetical protein ACTHOU_03120, partial [Aureliella sp.]